MPKPTKEITIEDERFLIRSLTWGELQEMRGMGKKKGQDRVGEIVMGCILEGDVGALSLREGVSAICAEIWAFTNGTDTQRGNSSSTGAGTPPSGASTATPAAAPSAPASV